MNMAKNGKTALEKLEGLVSIVARNVADIKDGMATKDDIANMATKDDIRGLATKMDLGDVERRLSAKIDAVEEKVDNLEMADILDLQGRVSVLEKDVKHIKRNKHA